VLSYQSKSMELAGGTNKLLGTLVVFLLPPIVKMHFETRIYL